MAGPTLRTITADELESGVTLDPAKSLEEGAILLFPAGVLDLPSAQDLTFLRDELARGMTLKNISYHPGGDYLSGFKGAGRDRTKSILREHSKTVISFFGDLLPRYAQHWDSGKVNFRPLQEKGRNLSRHSSNELVHVDAFASGATHGGRTLRFFTNIHPIEPRVWKSAGLFPELFLEFGHEAGVLPLGKRGLQEGALDQALSGFLRLIARGGIPQVKTVDSSPYDRAMKRMHDTLKDNESFQRDESRCSFFEFPPFSSWACLTDLISHACVSGQHALVNTWTVPMEALSEPHLAPFEVMARAKCPR